MQLDKGYLDYLKLMGEQTKDPKYIWMYLSVLADCLSQMTESPVNPQDKLMGMYKIQPPGGGSLHKGPPKGVVS